MKKYFTKKNIIITLVVIFVVIQFIRPGKNTGEVYGENDITKAVNVPNEVKNVLAVACYDCHSNHTNHMWYENIQPIGWWIANHINEGKRELNFSEFNSYKDKRKAHKFEEIGEMVGEGEMPMESYTWIHGNAKLNDEQARLLINWAALCQQQYKQEKQEGESH